MAVTQPAADPARWWARSDAADGPTCRPMETPRQHELLVHAREGCTVGECSCGRWRREADAETLALTGRSREDALRHAHELHSRGLDARA